MNTDSKFGLLLWLVLRVCMTGCKHISPRDAIAVANLFQHRCRSLRRTSMQLNRSTRDRRPTDGFYVAWVNHDANNQADVMLARFNSEGAAQGSPVSVNRQPGVATAWRGDQPSVAVAPNGACTCCGPRASSQTARKALTFISPSHTTAERVLRAK